MIKANELRIGNLVNRKFIDGVKQDTITGFDLWHSEKLNEAIHLYEWSIISEIPITEERLLKFGFEKHTQDIFSISICESNLKRLVIFNISSTKYGVGFVDYYTGKENSETLPTELESVHQLQNLYFALTGEELTIKE
jgi:hypothetical protein